MWRCSPPRPVSSLVDFFSPYPLDRPKSDSRFRLCSIHVRVWAALFALYWSFAVIPLLLTATGAASDESVQTLRQLNAKVHWDDAEDLAKTSALLEGLRTYALTTAVFYAFFAVLTFAGITRGGSATCIGVIVAINDLSLGLLLLSSIVFLLLAIVTFFLNVFVAGVMGLTFLALLPYTLPASLFEFYVFERLHEYIMECNQLQQGCHLEAAANGIPSYGEEQLHKLI